MIRPLTVVTFAAFFAAGLYVFQTKEEAGRLDRELRDLQRAAEQERARTQVFQAEWARLNDQERLRSLATTHLRELEPTPAAQFVRLEDSGRRLPAPVPFQLAGVNPFAPRADAPAHPGEALVVTAESLERDQRLAEPRVASAAGAAVARNTEPSPVAMPPVAPPPLALAPVSAPNSGAASREAAPPRPPVPVTPTPVAAPRPAPQAPALPRSGSDGQPAKQALSGATAREAAAAPRPAPRPAPPAVELAARRDLAPAAAPLAPPLFVAQAQPAMASMVAPGGSMLGRGAALPPPVPPAR